MRRVTALLGAATLGAGALPAVGASLSEPQKLLLLGAALVIASACGRQPRPSSTAVDTPPEGTP